MLECLNDSIINKICLHTSSLFQTHWRTFHHPSCSSEHPSSWWDRHALSNLRRFCKGSLTWHVISQGAKLPSFFVMAQDSQSTLHTLTSKQCCCVIRIYSLSYVSFAMPMTLTLNLTLTVTHDVPVGCSKSTPISSIFFVSLYWPEAHLKSRLWTVAETVTQKMITVNYQLRNS